LPRLAPVSNAAAGDDNWILDGKMQRETAKDAKQREASR
jgi:hypothetical protein